MGEIFFKQEKELEEEKNSFWNILLKFILQCIINSGTWLFNLDRRCQVAGNLSLVPNIPIVHIPIMII
ncbi:hypothetical protein T03_5975 [Trichinella britovi]|uniref:Uncharacterized protein n=2 Tax=Trichinella TaxID=6333 RepID=A0A0V1DH52_TRIBR|nr:hypothetical protein T05_10368 [Trichinella murrelli]KRY60789.1 hypothetical protein T03_5975 [Trichinella britovi]